MHDSHAILETLAYAIVLGILAQWLAHRLKLPAILPLLIFGMAAGPHGLRLFDPLGLGAAHLEVLIHVGVAIILFEGGLSLELRQLRTVGRTVRNLLTLGTAITGLGAAALAYALVGLAWPAAALFGAVVTVTGPTVIVPLLRHMVAPRKVRTTLISEGLMIDPVGAVLAYFVLQLIVRQELGARELLVALLTLTVVGVLVGFAAGTLARTLVASRYTPAELRALVVLAILLGMYLVAETMAPQSGVLAAVIMGLTVAAAGIPDLSPVKAFKGQLTVLIISVLFILLSAKLELAAMANLGIRGLVVTLGLILLVRPLAVLLSVPRGELDGRQRLMLALTAPRGIVAAAVASLSAIELRGLGHSQDAATLESLVYLTILVTCTWATLGASLLPRLLGYLEDRSRRRAILVGAHPLSLTLAKLLADEGWTANLVDASRTKLDQARAQGFTTVYGDARDTTTYEDAGIERDSHLLALTTNDELNMLIAGLVRNEFGVEHPVIAAQRPHEEFGRLRGAWVDLLGGGPLSTDRWSRLLEDQRAILVTAKLPADDALVELRSLLRTQSADYLMICGWNGHRPSFRLDLERLDAFERVSVLTACGDAHQRLCAAVSHGATQQRARAQEAPEPDPETAATNRPNQTRANQPETASVGRNDLEIDLA